MIYKNLQVDDYTITPFETNKEWDFNDSSSKIDVMEGLYITGSFYSGSNSEPTNSNGTYKRSVYHLIKHLYYDSNEPYKTFGGNVNYISDRTIHNRITVISIPQKVFGSKIKKSSVVLKDYNISGSGNPVILKDDGYGNLYDNAESASYAMGSGSVIGNVFYEHGAMVITATGSYASAALGTGAQGFDLSFQGTHVIYEHEAQCTVKAGEFNVTMNPSIRRSSGSEYKIAKVTGSNAEYFNPYVTEIGLYDDYLRLLAVGKLSKPLRIDDEIDVTFVVHWDA